MIRHPRPNLLAYAVKELFPDAQVTIGPVIENGFYYDFSYKRPFTPGRLGRHRKRMGRTGGQRTSLWCAACCHATRLWLTSRAGRHYKAEIIASIPATRT